MRGRGLGWIWVAGVCFAVFAYQHFARLHFSPDYIRGLVARTGSLAPAAFIALHVIAPVFFFPASLLAASALLAWRWPEALLWVTIGSNLCVNLMFLIGRRIGCRRVSRILEHRGWTCAHHRIEGAGFRAILLLRLVPMSPYHVINYGAGALGVRWRDFAFASLLGMLPGAVIFMYAGGSVHLVSSWIWLGIAVIAIVMFAVRATSLAQRIRETVPPWLSGMFALLLACFFSFKAGAQPGKATQTSGTLSKGLVTTSVTAMTSTVPIIPSRTVKTPTGLMVVEKLMPENRSSDRPTTAVVDTIMLHFSSDLIKNPDHPYDVDRQYQIYVDAPASTHYLIDREGTIYRFVPEERMAWHAGKGELPFEPRRRNILNFHSIGIEMLAVGNARDMKMFMPLPNYEQFRAKHPEWIGFTEAEYKSLNALINDIMKRHPEIKKDRYHIVGHEEYAVARRTDPGETFDWTRIGLTKERPLRDGLTTATVTPGAGAESEQPRD